MSYPGIKPISSSTMSYLGIKPMTLELLAPSPTSWAPEAKDVNRKNPKGNT